MGAFLRRMLERLTAPLRAVLSMPERMLSGSRRLGRLSLPARVALLTALFLVLCVALAVVLFCYFTPSAPFRQAKLNPTFWVTTAILVFAIPLALYMALRVWLEGEVSRFPDIDHAWKDGLAELQRHGLDLRQVPLFLVLGSSSEAQESALFGASRLDLSVRGVPEGGAPLHWYANADAIYLVCGRCCSLSTIVRTADKAVEQELERPMAGPSAPAADLLRQTIPAGGLAPRAPSPAEPRPDETSPRPRAPVDIHGTLMAPVAEEPAQRSAGQLARRDISVEGLRKAVEGQQARFEHLCRLIRRARQPYAPINGILTLLPFSLVQSKQPGVTSAISSSLRNDLATALGRLQIRCPVTALVVAMDEDAGFREFARRLVRRLGQEWVVEKRFGSGFPLEVEPTAERIEALATLACSAFETWIYDLFRDEDSLKRPGGNAGLFTFLCKIRRAQGNLASILQGVRDLESRSKHKPHEEADVLFFGGCYFAGTGPQEDRQAFVKSVLEKLWKEQQEDLEWTKAAIREDRRYQVLGNLALGFDTLVLLALVGAGIYWWVSGH